MILFVDLWKGWFETSQHHLLLHEAWSGVEMDTRRGFKEWAGGVIHVALKKVTEGVMLLWMARPTVASRDTLCVMSPLTPLALFSISFAFSFVVSSSMSYDVSSVVSLAVSGADRVGPGDFPVSPFCLLGGDEESHTRQRRAEQFQRSWLMLEEKSLRHGWQNW